MGVRQIIIHQLFRQWLGPEQAPSFCLNYGNSDLSNYPNIWSACQYEYERHEVSNHRSLDCLFNSLCGHPWKKHQSPYYWPFLRGIHRWPVNSPHQRPVARKKLPFDDVIMSMPDTCTLLATDEEYFMTMHHFSAEYEVITLGKNIERHTAETIVSWPNPKEWVIDDTGKCSGLSKMCIIRPCNWPLHCRPRRHPQLPHKHYGDVIMGAMASQITSLTIVYLTVYSGADKRK